MASFSPARRQKIEARAAELIAEEMSLRELRRAHAMTQRKMADSLGIGQEGVSRLEQRTDVLLSTLRSYVEALGGRLRVVAEFPDRPPVELSRISELDQPADIPPPHRAARVRRPTIRKKRPPAKR